MLIHERRLQQRAGTRIVFFPSEKVNGAGAPDQSTTSSPIFDAYTIKGEEKESYTLKWMYHGAQFIGVNTTWTPSTSDMTGFVIRADNDQILETTTSNDLFNSIHKIIDRSIRVRAIPRRTEDSLAIF